MTNLNNLDEIKALDQGNYWGSVTDFVGQIEQAWQDVKAVQIPEDYKNINKIVLNGMGGSALGARVVKAVYEDELAVPFEIINGYDIPAFVDDKTLFIFASYSGTTEEILSTVEPVFAKGAKCLGIAMGGKLEVALKEKNIPFYKINPVHNPSGQPRAAVGYSIMGILGMLSQIGLVKLDDGEVERMISELKNIAEITKPGGTGIPKLYISPKLAPLPPTRGISSLPISENQ